VFSGGGTTAVTAASEGYAVAGFEVNPFLAFVGNSKLLSCRGSTLVKYAKDVLDGTMSGGRSRLDELSTFSEGSDRNKWLFNREVLTAFDGGWKATVGADKAVRDLLRLCLVGSAMDVCNAIKDGKCLRYRTDWKTKQFGTRDFCKAFQDRIEMVKDDLKSSLIRKANAEIMVADSRTLDVMSLKGRNFKLCVTSPPYLNSFDYTDVYRPELFLVGLVKSQEELGEIRLRTVRSHVQANWAVPEGQALSPLLAAILSEVEGHSGELWNKRIPMMIQAYFEDMRQVLTRLKSLASPEASLWIVVSTSAYAGVEVPVDLILADIGSRCGWSLEEMRVLGCLRRVPGQQWDRLAIRNNKNPHLRESAVIFRNKPRMKYFGFAEKAPGAPKGDSLVLTESQASQAVSINTPAAD
jgi:sRNA-binding carbon storage regulator CsrA